MSSRRFRTHVTTSIPMRTQAPVFVPIKAVRPWERNVRLHSKKQLSQIESSLIRFGWTYPLIADQDGNVICGNGRLMAAQNLGLAKVPVIYLADLTDTEKRALALADNKIAANAGWDRKKLAAELGELAILLPDIALSLEDIGFETAEFDGLVADLGDGAGPLDTLPGTEPEAISRAGDLWRLGRHFILCGDSGRKPDAAAVFGRHKAKVVFIDAPYNLKISATVGRGRRKHREFAFASGEMSDAEYVEFLTRTFTLCATYSEPGALHYCAIDWRHMCQMWAAGVSCLGEVKNVVVWVKNVAGQGSFYRSQHELIFVFKSGDAPHQNNIQLGKFGRNRSNVWEYPRVDTFGTGPLADLTVHPTVKPVALVADAMRDCTRRGDIVYDPFLGSGTTIIAAETAGRRGYGIEIDPLYVDVAIRRWQAFTKSDAILVKTGQTFDELAAGGIRRVRSVK